MIIWNWYQFEELSLSQLYSILALRQDVFIREQRCFYSDIDGKDPKALHLLGMKNNQLMGYLRFFPKGVEYTKEATFGRFCIKPFHRGRGVGREMMQEFLAYFEEQYPSDSIVIMAQLYLQCFYEHFGFKVEGGAFDDEGILHINMRRAPSVG